jgi:hypothetical protein
MTTLLRVSCGSLLLPGNNFYIIRITRKQKPVTSNIFYFGPLNFDFYISVSLD